MGAMGVGWAKILLVEDDEGLLCVLERMLTGAGLEVRTARNGKEALTKLTPEIDVVISDIIMPEMDGLDLLRRIRKETPGTRIIAISGGGIQDKEHVLEIARHMGAGKVLAKPFTSEQLLGAVRELLDRRAVPG